MNKVIDKGFRSCRFVSTIVKHPVLLHQQRRSFDRAHSDVADASSLFHTQFSARFPFLLRVGLRGHMMSVIQCQMCITWNAVFFNCNAFCNFMLCFV